MLNNLAVRQSDMNNPGCRRRVPGVQGGNHDFGADGKLLVCDRTGTYLVDVGCVLTLVSTLLPLSRCLTTPTLGVATDGWVPMMHNVCTGIVQNEPHWLRCTAGRPAGMHLRRCWLSDPFESHGRRSVIRLQKPAAIAAEGDGPCKFFRDGHRWVLGDTYREPRKMYLWDLYRSDVFTVGILDSADWPGPAHALAPLNPHWSPDGACCLRMIDVPHPRVLDSTSMRSSPLACPASRFPSAG